MQIYTDITFKALHKYCLTAVWQHPHHIRADDSGRPTAVLIVIVVVLA